MAGKHQKTFIDLKMEGAEITFYKIERQFPWETKMILNCLALGLVKLNENTLGLPGVTKVGNLDLYYLVEWMNTHSEELQEQGILITTDRAPYNIFTGKISADIRVEPGEDWFDVKAVVFFGTIEVPFIQLRHYILEGIREFPLPGGEVVILPWEWFNRYGDLFYFSEVIDGQLKLPYHYVQLVKDLNLPGNPALSERLNRLNPELTFPVSIPETLKAILRPYQIEGLQWLFFYITTNLADVLPMIWAWEKPSRRWLCCSRSIQRPMPLH